MLKFSIKSTRGEYIRESNPSDLCHVLTLVLRPTWFLTVAYIVHPLLRLPPRGPTSE